MCTSNASCRERLERSCFTVPYFWSVGDFERSSVGLVVVQVLMQVKVKRDLVHRVDESFENASAWLVAEGCAERRKVGMA